MSRKSQLKKEIGDVEREISALEQKRERSQSALMRAMLSKQKPDPQDEEFFRVFTTLIDNAREHLRTLLAELEELNGGKKAKEKPDKNGKK